MYAGNEVIHSHGLTHNCQEWWIGKQKLNGFKVMLSQEIVDTEKVFLMVMFLTLILFSFLHFIVSLTNK